jgi:HTH-type transcriptional regulator/antitoxin HigA
MNITLITTAADYAAALKEIDELMSADLGTPAGNRLKALASLVEAYEAK